MNEAIVWLLCVLWVLFCILDLAVYLRTPLKERLAWPSWRYLPGGALVYVALHLLKEKEGKVE